MAFLDDAGLVQVWQNISARLSNKMDVIPGKVLSSNDFTDELKAKLDSLEKAAQPDWAASEGEEGYILNKPVIPSLDGVAMKEDLNELASTNYVDTKVAELVDSSPDTLNTLNELAAALGDDPNFATTVATQIGEIKTALNNKVEKISGKGLSTNDFSNVEKNLLATIASDYLTSEDKTEIDAKLDDAYAHAENKGNQYSSGLYKITTNAEGHVTSATAVAKADITALGIPAQDTDTGATSVEVTGAGNAITAASYDAASRKLTLTKGATYTNNQGTITGVNAGTSLSGGGTSGAISINHAEGSAINKTVGLYKFATDATSHVKSVTAVNKADIVALGIPAQDTTYSAITNDEIDAICGQVIASISEVSW